MSAPFLDVPGGWGLPGTNTGGIGGWWGRQSPEIQSALLGGGIGLLGSTIQGIGEGRALDKQLAQSAEDRAIELARNRGASLSGYQQGLTEDDYRRAVLGLEASQMNPLAQQEARQRMAIKAALLANAQPHGRQGSKLTGGLRIPEGGFGPDVMNLFTPGAMASAEAPFWSSYGQAAPHSMMPNLGAMGYGEAGSSAMEGAAANQAIARQQLEERRKAQYDAIMAALNEETQAVNRIKQKPKKSKLGGFGSGAAAGATFGSNFGPIGTGIGAGIGGLIGLFR